MFSLYCVVSWDGDAEKYILFDSARWQQANMTYAPSVATCVRRTLTSESAFPMRPPGKETKTPPSTTTSTVAG